MDLTLRQKLVAALAFVSVVAHAGRAFAVPSYSIANAPSDVLPGAVFTVDIILDLDSNSSTGHEMSVRFTPGPLAVVDAAELSVPPYELNLSPGVRGINNAVGVVEQFEAAAFVSITPEAPFVVGQITFQAGDVGGATITAFFGPGAAVLGGNSQPIDDVAFNSVNVNVIPIATPTPPPTSVLDHFLCYRARTARGAGRFEKREVQLIDQFQERTVELVKPLQFCNAVDKNGEGINDPTAHLTCYMTRKPVSIRSQVITTDQFGELDLNVRKQKTQLCVPSQEVGQPSALNLDHFDLYRTTRTPRTPRFERREVNLVDQFLAGDVTLTRPLRLGVPTNKNGEGINDADSHLTCYLLRAPRFRRRDVEVQDQFGQLRLTVMKPYMLCVPSDKQVVSDQ